VSAARDGEPCTEAAKVKARVPLASSFQSQLASHNRCPQRDPGHDFPSEKGGRITGGWLACASPRGNRVARAGMQVAAVPFVSPGHEIGEPERDRSRLESLDVSTVFSSISRMIQNVKRNSCTPCLLGGGRILLPAAEFCALEVWKASSPNHSIPVLRFGAAHSAEDGLVVIGESKCIDNMYRHVR